MRMRERRALEDALRDHYRAVPGTDAAAPPRALVEAVAAEMARPSRPRAAEVVSGQARRVGAGAWALLIPSTYFSPIAQKNRRRSRKRTFASFANGLPPLPATPPPSSRVADPSAGRTCR